MHALSVAELEILNWIAAHCHGPVLDVIFPVITHLGALGAVWIVMALVLMCVPGQRSCGAQVALALIFSAIICNLILKNAVGRIRPYELAGITELLVEQPWDASFPSGHTSAGIASATVLLLNRHRLRWPVLILAVLIAFSRLYLYVHFPTDVLAGALIGVLCGVLAVISWRKLVQPWLIQRYNKIKRKKDAP